VGKSEVDDDEEEDEVVIGKLRIVINLSVLVFDIKYWTNNRISNYKYKRIR